MLCKNCGAELPEDALFCYGCGIKQVSEKSSSGQQSEPVLDKKVPKVVKTPQVPKIPKAPKSPKPQKKSKPVKTKKRNTELFDRKRSVVIISVVATLLIAAVIMSVILAISIFGNRSVKTGAAASTDYASVSEITMGKYDGEELIWKVLSVDEDGLALVLCDTAIGTTTLSPDEYGGKFVDNWSDSEARQFLNSEFFNDTFTNDEKMAIKRTEIDLTDGNTSSDDIFVLSEDEYNEYMVKYSEIYTSIPKTTFDVQLTKEESKITKLPDGYKYSDLNVFNVVINNISGKCVTGWTIKIKVNDDFKAEDVKSLCHWATIQKTGDITIPTYNVAVEDGYLYLSPDNYIVSNGKIVKGDGETTDFSTIDAGSIKLTLIADNLNENTDIYALGLSSQWCLRCMNSTGDMGYIDDECTASDCNLDNYCTIAYIRPAMYVDLSLLNSDGQ